MIKTIVLLALLATPPAETYTATVVRPPHPGASWLEVTEGGVDSTYLSLADDCAIVWHLDGVTPLSRADLRPGVRVRYSGPSCTLADRVEVCCLGPLAMGVAVEEWVVEASGRKLEAGLSPTELEVVKALGSPSWLVRGAVADRLREQGARAWRFLCWAKASPDPEVRVRAESLLSALGWERP